jgi:chemotaxis protein MotB
LKRNQQHNWQADEQNSPGWLTTFNDLVTLLMVFFVLLFTMSSIDKKKMSDFQYALQSGLGVLKQGKNVQIEIKENQPIRDMSNINTQAPGWENKPQGQNRQDFMQDAMDALSADIGIRVIYTHQGARLRFEDELLFSFGRAQINPEGFSFLDKIAGAIHKMPYPIRVEGHTDNVPIHTKRFPSNWELSTARAVNVVKYFVDTCKVDPQRLSAVGYGESKPLVSNDSAAQRSKNRRVEIVLMNEDLN